MPCQPRQRDAKKTGLSGWFTGCALRLYHCFFCCSPYVPRFPGCWKHRPGRVFTRGGLKGRPPRSAPVGNAVLAGVGVGLYPDFTVVEDWVHFSDHHEPNSQAHEEYMKYYEIFCRLYGEVEGEYKELAKATGYC